MLASYTTHQMTEPIVDLAYERTNREYRRAINQLWSEVLRLSTLYGTRLITHAGWIVINACDLHIASMVREFESVAPQLRSPVDQSALRIELHTEMYELNRVSAFEQVSLYDRETDVLPCEIVNTKVVNFLQKMEVIRNAFGRTAQTFRRLQ
ncbi:hypothetical protein DPMN_124286 [Dreissena polymorpha]|uniref:Uncharacterized protein n=1 Tax=Dreissena polymorpha TaxID=45954 RepID=A0A9D4GW35_DREPO|nr:hypothetical protein DPMN_124286 [Dreissena polymorpha]